jgi:hypothetical protein
MERQTAGLFIGDGLVHPIAVPKASRRRGGHDRAIPPLGRVYAQGTPRELLPPGLAERTAFVGFLLFVLEAE